MLTKSEMPVSLEKALRSEFQAGRREALSQGDYYWNQITTVVGSNAADEKFHMFGARGKMRLWTDERKPEKFNEYSYIVTNKDYEKSIAVDRDLLEDDQTGEVRRYVREWGWDYDRDVEDILLAHLRQGSSNLCYDGQYFFDTDHAEASSGTQTNMRGASLISASMVQDIVTRFTNFKDDKGMPAHSKFTHLVVYKGSSNHWASLELSQSAISIEATYNKTNIFKGLFQVIPVEYGITVNEMIALDLSGMVKPLVVTDRKGFRNPNFTALENTSDSGFHRREYVYGIDNRFGLGYYDWRKALAYINL